MSAEPRKKLSASVKKVEYIYVIYASSRTLKTSVLCRRNYNRWFSETFFQLSGNDSRYAFMGIFSLDEKKIFFAVSLLGYTCALHEFLFLCVFTASVKLHKLRGQSPGFFIVLCLKEFYSDGRILHSSCRIEMGYYHVGYLLSSQTAGLQACGLHKGPETFPSAEIYHSDSVFRPGSVFVHQRNDIAYGSYPHQVKISRKYRSVKPCRIDKSLSQLKRHPYAGKVAERVWAVLLNRIYQRTLCCAFLYNGVVIRNQNFHAELARISHFIP